MSRMLKNPLIKDIKMLLQGLSVYLSLAFSASIISINTLNEEETEENGGGGERIPDPLPGYMG